MKISIITPTYGRERYLPSLYRNFAEQTYADRELLIHDDSPLPSPFFTGLHDPRVSYEHTGERATIGRKAQPLDRTRRR